MRAAVLGACLGVFAAFRILGFFTSLGSVPWILLGGCDLGRSVRYR